MTQPSEQIDLEALLAALADMADGLWKLVDATVAIAPGNARDDLINAKTNTAYLKRNLTSAGRSYSAWRAHHTIEGQGL